MFFNSCNRADINYLGSDHTDRHLSDFEDQLKEIGKIFWLESNLLVNFVGLISFHLIYMHTSEYFVIENSQMCLFYLHLSKILK